MRNRSSRPRHIRPGAVRFGLAVAIATSFVSSAGIVRADEPPPLVHIEGSQAECVMVYLGQGVTLAQTAALCDVQIGIIGVGDTVATTDGGLASIDGSFPGFQNAEPGPVNVSCPSSAGADPTLSEPPAGKTPAPAPAPVPPEKKNVDEAEKKLSDFDDATRTPPSDPEARQKYYEQRNALVADVNSARAALEATRADRPLREQQAKDTAEMLHGMTKNPLKGKGVPGGATVDIVTSACQQAAAFIGECNLSGWATSPCQMFRNQMEGCADQTIAYTTGEPGDGCARLADAGDAGAIVHLRCSKTGKVMPEMDPCASPDVGGGPGVYRLPNGDACSVNPWASSGDTSRTTGEGCEKEFASMLPSTFGNPYDLATLIVVLGGPGAPTTDGGFGTVSPPPGCTTCWGGVTN